MKSKFILSLLSILGFTGCAETTETPCMYGVPLLDYRYTGEVTDTEGNPLRGIQVELGSKATVSTDESGIFSFDLYDYSDLVSTLTFTDIDGEENGGEFATKEIYLYDTEAEEEGNFYVYNLGITELELKSEE